MSRATTSKPEMTSATTVPVLSSSSAPETATAEPTSVVVVGRSGGPVRADVVLVATPDDVGVPGTRRGTLAVVVELSEGSVGRETAVVVVGRVVLVGPVVVVVGAARVVLVGTTVVLVARLEVEPAVELTTTEVVLDGCTGGTWPVAGGAEAPNAKEVTIAASAPMTMTRTLCDRAVNP